MARFVPILVLLFVSLFNIASAFDPSSIELSIKANKLYQTWKRNKLASDLAKKENDPKSHALHIASQQGELEFISAYKSATTQMIADLNVLYNDDSRLEGELDEYERRFDAGEIEWSEWFQHMIETNQRINAALPRVNQIANAYEKIMHIADAYEKIMHIETPKPSPQLPEIERLPEIKKKVTGLKGALKKISTVVMKALKSKRGSGADC